MGKKYLSKHFQRVVKGIPKASKSSWWSSVFHPSLNFQYKWELHNWEQLWQKLLHDVWLNIHMIFGKGGSWKVCFVYGTVTKSLHGLVSGGIIYWYVTPLGKPPKSRLGTMSFSRLLTSSLGSAFLSFRKFRSQQLLCNQGAKYFTIGDYKKIGIDWEGLSYSPPVIAICSI